MNWFYEIFLCPQHGFISYWPLLLSGGAGLFVIAKTYANNVVAFFHKFK